MRTWFENLAPRERLMVALGGFAAVVIILWGFIWVPLSRGAAELTDSVAEKSALLVDLERAEGLPGGSGQATAPRDASESLVVLVDRTAQPLGLAGFFTRTRPDGADAISVSFQNAPFDTLMAWLIGLEQSYALAVESASFNGSRQPGLVSGQIFLRRR